jgi:hypothetical protein
MASIIYDIGFRVDSKELSGVFSTLNQDIEKLSKNKGYVENMAQTERLIKQASERAHEFAVEVQKVTDSSGQFAKVLPTNTKNIKEATLAANAMEIALKRATTDKGLSLPTLRASLKEMGYTTETMIKKLSSLGMNGSMNAFLNQIGGAKSGMIAVNEEVAKLVKGLGQSLQF